MNQRDELLTRFGMRLKSEREKQGLTQQALATKAYTKQDYLAQIERGTRNPSLKTLLNILSALDVSADYLIFGVGENNVDEEDPKILTEFISFLSRRGYDDVRSYYEIVKFMSKYIESH